eukprot:1160300-Pelagomonas_calceolata.AAC.3
MSKLASVSSTLILRDHPAASAYPILPNSSSLPVYSSPLPIANSSTTAGFLSKLQATPSHSWLPAGLFIEAIEPTVNACCAAQPTLAETLSWPPPQTPA